METIVQNILENYPETLKAAYVVNASNIFQLVFKIVQSTVQQKTLSKIKIFGKDNWPLDIKKLVDNASVNRGGVVPATMYYVNGNDSYDNIALHRARAYCHVGNNPLVLDAILKNRVVTEPGKIVRIKIKSTQQRCQLR